jgi:hypothetical protein
MATTFNAGFDATKASVCGCKADGVPAAAAGPGGFTQWRSVGQANSASPHTTYSSPSGSGSSITQELLTAVTGTRPSQAPESKSASWLTSLRAIFSGPSGHDRFDQPSASIPFTIACLLAAVALRIAFGRRGSPSSWRPRVSTPPI